jgi:hypothetical protein
MAGNCKADLTAGLEEGSKEVSGLEGEKGRIVLDGRLEGRS